MDEAIQALLFQFVRELLFNVVKHAGTNQATVELQAGKHGLLYLIISDLGRGFEVATIAAKAGVGFGLFRGRERLAFFGGRMEIQSAPGQGTRIVLTIPTAVLA